jgi:molybdate transport system substrate-binding protein
VDGAPVLGDDRILVLRHAPASRLRTMTRITGISSMATRQVLAELAAAFERESGLAVAIESVGGVDAAKRVEASEPFDVVILAANAIDRLVAGGHVLAGSIVDLVRSGVAIAVRAGAGRPDVGTEEAVREAVRRARSVAYSTGPSGDHLAKLFERWGIAEDVRSRTVKPPPGVPVGTLVASGEVELGFQQLSELAFLPGVDVVGPLPPAIQLVTVFSGGVCVNAPHPDEARRLLAFLASPQAAEAKHRNGMEPA